MNDILEKLDLTRLLRYALFMLLTLMFQNMVLSHIRPLGVCPLVLPAAAAAVGMFEGATFGPVFSLITGYFADMSFVENRIFFLLLLPVLSLLAAFVSQFFGPESAESGHHLRTPNPQDHGAGRLEHAAAARRHLPDALVPPLLGAGLFPARQMEPGMTSLKRRRFNETEIPFACAKSDF